MKASIPGVLATSSFLLAAMAHAAPVLDQEHAPPFNSAGLSVADDRTQIQTFTVGITGLLTRIDVKIARGAQTVEDLVLGVWSATSSGVLLYELVTVSVPPSTVALGEAYFVSIELGAGAVMVNAGAQLAITLDSLAGNLPPFEERWVVEIGGQYAGGTAYTYIPFFHFQQLEDWGFRTYVDPVATVTTIDIKPGSDRNPVNPRSRGNIPVAVLSTAVFDALAINPSSVRFGPQGTEARPVGAAVDDVNDDGRPDLLLHFDMEQVGFICGQTSASLSGQTIAGDSLQGSDSIATVGCK